MEAIWSIQGSKAVNLIHSDYRYYVDLYSEGVFATGSETGAYADDYYYRVKEDGSREKFMTLEREEDWGNNATTYSRDGQTITETEYEQLRNQYTKIPEGMIAWHSIKSE